MKTKHLQMNRKDFDNFANSQSNLNQLPGDHPELVLSAADFEWISDWRQFEKAILPMEDTRLVPLRAAHYAGWYAYEHRIRKLG